MTVATTKELMSIRLREETTVTSIASLKIITLLDKLCDIDIVLPLELPMDLILLSLPSSYQTFIVNWNMKKLEPLLEELVNMLKSMSRPLRRIADFARCPFYLINQERFEIEEEEGEEFHTEQKDGENLIKYS